MQSTQPLNSETIEVTSSCGLKNMPRNWLEFHASTHTWLLSQLTMDCSGVLAMTVMAGDAAS